MKNILMSEKVLEGKVSMNPVYHNGFIKIVR